MDDGERRQTGPQGRGGARRPPRWLNVGDPPAPPAGMSTGPPNFVGVGAQRAGTKWWYELIVDHPRVERVATTKKELHYFDRFFEGEFTDSDIQAYHGFFPRPEGSIAGEWTPRYMHDPWIPPLIARAAPDAKLLVLLRDPVERFHSGLAREQKLAAKRGRPLEASTWSDAVARGMYATQLDHLMRHFERGRVLVLQYECCATDPLPELRRTYEFLGVEPDHVPDTLGDFVGRVHEKREMPEHVRSELVALYRPEVERLAAAWPALDLSLWPHFAA